MKRDSVSRKKNRRSSLKKTNCSTRKNNPTTRTIGGGIGFKPKDGSPFSIEEDSITVKKIYNDLRFKFGITYNTNPGLVYVLTNTTTNEQTRFYSFQKNKVEGIIFYKGKYNTDPVIIAKNESNNYTVTILGEVQVLQNAVPPPVSAKHILNMVASQQQGVNSSRKKRKLNFEANVALQSANNSVELVDPNIKAKARAIYNQQVKNIREQKVAAAAAAEQTRLEQEAAAAAAAEQTRLEQEAAAAAEKNRLNREIAELNAELARAEEVARAEELAEEAAQKEKNRLMKEAANAKAEKNKEEQNRLEQEVRAAKEAAAEKNRLAKEAAVAKTAVNAIIVDKKGQRIVIGNTVKSLVRGQPDQGSITAITPSGIIVEFRYSGSKAVQSGQVERVGPTKAAIVPVKAPVVPVSVVQAVQPKPQPSGANLLRERLQRQGKPLPNDLVKPPVVAAAAAKPQPSIANLAKERAARTRKPLPNVLPSNENIPSIPLVEEPTSVEQQPQQPQQTPLQAIQQQVRTPEQVQVLKAQQQTMLASLRGLGASMKLGQGQQTGPKRGGYRRKTRKVRRTKQRKTRSRRRS